jgi:TRAP-type C4-dicarboxylate transport system substrate-binding protein
MTIRTPAIAAVLLLSGAAIGSPALAQERLQMLIPFPPGHALNATAERFAANLEEATEGRFNIDLVGTEVVPGFEQFEPVSQGLFDMALQSGAYHTGVTGVGLATDAIDADPAARREASVWDAYDEYYQRYNLKLISFPSADDAYHIMLREPIGADGGLEGRIIRGTMTYHSIINTFGGSPVVMPVAEIYPAAERGVIDGAGHNSFGNIQLGLHEVLPYLARPSFGVTSMFIFMHMDRWNALSEEDQAIFLEVGEALEHEMLEYFAGLVEEETERMGDAGASITEFGPEQTEQVAEVFAVGLWEEAIRLSGDDAARIRDIAREAGLTP